MKEGIPKMPDPIATIKNISELVKKYNDLDLMKQIVDLQQEVFDLKAENLTLKEQISKLNTKEKIVRREPFGYYYKDGEDVPHCSKCWEGDGKAVTLPSPSEHGSYIGRRCRVCNFLHVEGKRSEGETPRRQIGGVWS
jgi:hypothetical protein